MPTDEVSWDDPIALEALDIIADKSRQSADGLSPELVIEAMYKPDIVNALKAAFMGRCTVRVKDEAEHCLTVDEYLSSIRKIKNDA